MATPNPLVCIPNPVPAGGTGEIDVTFQLAPGTPDKATDATLTKDGVVMGSGSIVLKGTPAETPPVVAIGASGVGWEIQVSAGTLTALGSNRFSIRY